MRYALRKQDKIASAFGDDYLKNHIIQSLDSFFEKCNDRRISIEVSQEVYTTQSGVNYPLLRINDRADDNCMLEFAVISNQYDVMHLSFLGRMKG